MGATSGIGSGAAGPWYRVQAILADGRQGASAERDYASVLPAALNAAMHRRPFVAGWLSRGGGAPLELITNAGPLPEPSLPDPPRVSQAHAASLRDRAYLRPSAGRPAPPAGAEPGHRPEPGDRPGPLARAGRGIPGGRPVRAEGTAVPVGGAGRADVGRAAGRPGPPGL